MIMDGLRTVRPAASVAPKRSFDVAFLTGSKDLSDITPTKLTRGTARTPTGENVSPTAKLVGRDVVTSRRSEGPDAGSAFTKVATRGPPVSMCSSLTPTSESFSSFLTGTKNFSNLSPFFSSGLLPPMLSPLLPAGGPECLKNNLVEEYLKSHQMFSNKFSPAEAYARLSPAAALSRLRASLYPSPDPYKMPFPPMPYALPTPNHAGVPKLSPPFLTPSVSVSSLMPPTLTPMSLPAQNLCAKCNISFRMTSDLVYHMRSQHKREPDPFKKRRDEKLKCLICGESFRERHHLTRHMSAHQNRAEEEDAK